MKKSLPWSKGNGWELGWRSTGKKGRRESPWTSEKSEVTHHNMYSIWYKNLCWTILYCEWINENGVTIFGAYNLL